MRPRTVREPRCPDVADLQALEAVVQEVRPDRPALTEWASTYGKNHTERFAFDLGLVRRYVHERARLLEVGVVPPFLTIALRRAGYRPVGIDIDPSRFASVLRRHDIHVVRGDIERSALPLGDGTFDAVLFNEIFEHLRIDPVQTMQEVRRVLRPGGVLLLSTPNLRSLEGLINFLRHHRAESCSARPYDEFEKLRTIGHMGHVREYTPVEVAEFLDRIGFRVEHVIHRGRYRKTRMNLPTRLFAGLRPFVSFHCIRDGKEGAERGNDQWGK